MIQIILETCLVVLLILVVAVAITYSILGVYAAFFTH